MWKLMRSDCPSAVRAVVLPPEVVPVLFPWPPVWLERSVTMHWVSDTSAPQLPNSAAIAVNRSDARLVQSEALGAPPEYLKNVFVWTSTSPELDQMKSARRAFATVGRGPLM